MTSAPSLPRPFSSRSHGVGIYRYGTVVAACEMMFYFTVEAGVWDGIHRRGWIYFADPHPLTSRPSQTHAPAVWILLQTMSKRTIAGNKLITTLCSPTSGTPTGGECSLLPSSGRRSSPRGRLESRRKGRGLQTSMEPERHSRRL